MTDGFRPVFSSPLNPLSPVYYPPSQAHNDHGGYTYTGDQAEMQALGAPQFQNFGMSPHHLYQTQTPPQHGRDVLYYGFGTFSTSPIHGTHPQTHPQQDFPPQFLPGLGFETFDSPSTQYYNHFGSAPTPTSFNRPDRGSHLGTRPIMPFSHLSIPPPGFDYEPANVRNRDPYKHGITPLRFRDQSASGPRDFNPPRAPRAHVLRRRQPTPIPQPGRVDEEEFPLLAPHAAPSLRKNVSAEVEQKVVVAVTTLERDTDIVPTLEDKVKMNDIAGLKGRLTHWLIPFYSH